MSGAARSGSLPTVWETRFPTSRFTSAFSGSGAESSRSDQSDSSRAETSGSIAELRPIDRATGGEDFVHVSAKAGWLKGSRQQEHAHEEVQQDDPRHPDVRPVALLREREETQHDAGHRGEDHQQDPEVQVAG